MENNQAVPFQGERGRDLNDHLRSTRLRKAWFGIWPPLALAVAYIINWLLLFGAGAALGNSDSNRFECWGRTVQTGPHAGGCESTWGWWSALLYLPELLLLATVAFAATFQDSRLLRRGAVVTLASVTVPWAVLGFSHGWAFHQAPLIWPPLP